MNTESKKNRIALISIGLSLLGCLISYFVHIGSDSFGIGAVVTVVAFLISLMSVQDRGSNVLAKVAFFLSTAAVFISVWFGAIR